MSSSTGSVTAIRERHVQQELARAAAAQRLSSAKTVTRDCVAYLVVVIDNCVESTIDERIIAYLAVSVVLFECHNQLMYLSSWLTRTYPATKRVVDKIFALVFVVIVVVIVAINDASMLLAQENQVVIFESPADLKKMFTLRPLLSRRATMFALPCFIFNMCIS